MGGIALTKPRFVAAGCRYPYPKALDRVFSENLVTIEPVKSSRAMMRAREDQLFARFCRTGDPRAAGAVFDRTAPELWRVATYLTSDRHMAEDAVQSTFLAAIEHHADWDPKRPVQPWLLGLLANRVRELKRRQSRSIDADLIGTKPVPRPEESAQQAELEAAFLAALGDVPEPHRSALEGHLVQGKSSAELARDLGVPAGTVRMRLHRGLDQLRRRLPAGVSLAYAAVPLPPGDVLASVRGKVVSAANSAGPTSTFAATTTLPFGLVFMKKSALALVALLTAGLGALVLQHVITDSEGLNESTRILSLRTVSPLEVPSLPPQLTAPDPSTGPREAQVTAVEGPSTAAPEIPEGWGLLNLKFIKSGTGEPVPGLVLELKPKADPRLRRLARTDDGGAFSQQVLAGEINVTCNMIRFGSRLKFDVTPGMVTEAVVELPHRLKASITVEGPDGYPVAGARVVGWATLDGVKSWDEPVVGNTVERELGVTDGQGHLELSMIDASLTVRATLAGFAASRVTRVEGGSHELVLRLGHGAASIRGTVTGYGGLLEPFAPVWLERVTVPPEPAVRIAADVDGQFVAAELPAGSYRVYARAAAPGAGLGGRSTSTKIELPPGGDVQAHLTFAKGARAVLVVLDADGEPIKDEIFVAKRLEDGETTSSAELNDCSGYTDANGRCDLVHLSPGDYQFTCLTRSGRVIKERASLAEGDTFEWRPITTGEGRVEVQVLAAGLLPLVEWVVELADEEGRTVMTGLTDESGRLRLEGLTPGPFLMRIRATRSTPPSHEELVEAGANVRVLVATDKLPEGSIIGRVQPDQGVIAAELAVRLFTSPGPSATARLDHVTLVQVATSGDFSVEGLPAGHYAVMVVHLATGVQLAVRPVQLIGAGDREDMGVIKAVSSELSIRVTPPIASDVPEVNLWMAPSPSETAVLTQSPFERVGDRLYVRDMPGGTYTFVVWGDTVAPVRLESTMDAGSPRPLSAVLETCPTVRVEIQGPRKADLTLTFFLEDGQVVSLQHGAGGPLAFGIPIGSHRVTLKSAGQEIATAQFQVESEGSPAIVLAGQ